jgi:hypothetical protein
MPQGDRGFYRAGLRAGGFAAGVVGLTIGMWFVFRNSKDDTYHDYD